MATNIRRTLKSVRTQFGPLWPHLLWEDSCDLPRNLTLHVNMSLTAAIADKAALVSYPLAPSMWLLAKEDLLAYYGGA